ALSLPVVAFIAVAQPRTQDLVPVDASALGPVARAQINALVAEKEARTAIQQKIDSRVLLTIDSTRPSPRRQVLKSVAKAPVQADGRVIVDIDLSDAKAVKNAIVALRQ